MDAISSMKFDYVASGHYAHVVHSSPDRKDMSSVLELSNDMVPMWNMHSNLHFWLWCSFLIFLFVVCLIMH